MRALHAVTLIMVHSVLASGYQPPGVSPVLIWGPQQGQQVWVWQEDLDAKDNQDQAWINQERHPIKNYAGMRKNNIRTIMKKDAFFKHKPDGRIRFLKHNH